MDEIIKSGWFVFFTGSASIVGVLLSIYQLKIKGMAPSLYRSKLWFKSIFVSLSFGMIVVGFVGFVNQDNPPPDDTFRKLYDGFHGINRDWEEGYYQFSSVIQNDSLNIMITGISVEREFAIVHYKEFVWPKNDSSLTISAFQSPILQVENRKSLNLMKQEVRIDSNLTVLGRLYFPTILGKSGDVSFWKNEEDFSSEPFFKKIFVLSPIIPRENGTYIWIVLFFLGCILFIFSIQINVMSDANSELINEFERLNRKKSLKLEAILNNKKYEELAYHEKLEYDQIVSFYGEAIKELSKAVMGINNEAG